MKHVPFILKVTGWLLMVYAFVKYPSRFWWVWLICGFVMEGYAKFIIGPGRFGFWRLVAKFPVEAYYFFKQNPSWHIVEGPLPEDYKRLFPKDKWAGPYHLIVPEIGKIYIFGKSGEYEVSQKDFLVLIKNKFGKRV